MPSGTLRGRLASGAGLDTGASMRQFAIGMMLTIWGGAALHPARAIHARDLSPELTVGLAAGEFNLAYEADADRATGASVGATASTRCSTPTRT